MRYCVLYPKAENVHLIKDVGMLAYKMHSLYGYDAFVASYNNGEYDYLNNEVKGLRQEFINKKHGHFLNIFLYLKKNSGKIDVLQIFHMTANSVIYAVLYKLFNKNGIVFLKLDCTEALLDKIKAMNFAEKFFFNFFLNRVNIIGVEQKNIYTKLKELLKKHSYKLLNVPNGMDYKSDALKEKVDFHKKENIILTVGRIGSPEKASDLLMRAFSKVEESVRKTWKLVFVGPIENEFKSTIEEFFNINEKLKDVVLFKGPIYDRNELYNEYKKAKIFCLTSNFESVGISLIEAAAFGDVIVSTKVGIAEEIVLKRNGITVPVGDEEGLSNALTSLLTSRELEKFSKDTENLCREEYNLDLIVESLNNKIKKLRGNN
jgi:glycosyltransferase involved in cell wall biosynthesis